MAFTNTIVWEVESGGSDANNGGGFDPGQTAGMLTDGAATSATTSAPVFTSASYNFVAGDVGAWVYISSGTNWTPGWYKIASVAANAATLAATIGTATLKGHVSVSTATGCATTGSPTSATWSIDYSQGTSAQFSYTDLASAGSGLLVSSVAIPFGKQMVGNALVITAGTNFNTGRYLIASVSAGFVATVIGGGNITSGVGVSGVGGQGGALATVQKGLDQMVQSGAVADTICYIKAATYNISTALSCGSITGVTYENRVVGYNSVHADTPNGSSRPTIATNGNGVNGLNIANTGWRIENLIFDGSVSTRGLIGCNISGKYNTVYNCKFTGWGSPGIFINNIFLCNIIETEVTACCNTTGSYAIDATGLGLASILNCWVHNNPATGINLTASGENTGSVIGCRVTNNTGGTSDGIYANYSATIKNNTVYANGRDGIRLGQAYSSIGLVLRNNILMNNGGYGINYTSAPQYKAIPPIDYNAVKSNTSGNYNNISASPHDVLMTADPFTNAAGDDYTLNNTAGGGAVCRAVGDVPYIDIGALQHQDSGGGSTINIFISRCSIICFLVPVTLNLRYPPLWIFPLGTGLIQGEFFSGSPNLRHRR